MSFDVTVEDVSGGQPKGAATKSAPSRGPGITEDVTVGSLISRPAKSGEGGTVEDVPLAGPRAQRQVPETAAKLLAKLEPTEPDAKTETAAKPEPKPEVKTEPRAEPHPDVARLIEANNKLLAEIETLRGRPQRELTAREKALDEVERTYHDDTIGALRRLVATALGVTDLQSKEVDEELRGIYNDLTEKELGVPLDAALKNSRENIRTRRIVERERRERMAAAEQPPEDPVIKRDKEMIGQIGNHLTLKDADGKSHVDHYPLLHKLSNKLAGAAPAELIWKQILRGVSSGEIDPKSSNELILRQVSDRLEKNYQSLVDEISTARPTQATATTTDQKADPNQNGVRAITSASASVAPATPPAPKPDQTKPKFRSEKERRMAIVRQKFGEK